MYWAEFFTIAVAHLFAVASPGPDFAIVTRQCMSGGTRAGVWTSLGVSSAILLHVTYCILGVALLLAQSTTLFNSMKYLAAAYLVYLGVQSIRGSFRQTNTESLRLVSRNRNISMVFDAFENTGSVKRASIYNKNR